SLPLCDRVVNRVRGWHGRAEAETGLEIEAGQVIAELSAASAQLETRRDGVALAAGDSETVVRIVASLFGLDVDNAGCAVSILGGQYSIDQAYTLDEIGVQ